MSNPEPQPLEFTPEEHAEFEFWEAVSARAWQWIDDFERAEALLASDAPPEPNADTEMPSNE